MSTRFGSLRCGCIYHAGAGLHVSNTGPIANNSLVSGSAGQLVDCISNSSLSGVGSITLVNGSTLVHYAETDFWLIVNPYHRPGVIRIHIRSVLPSSDQGIYTCIIPDSNGHQITLSFGLYPHGFMGKETLTITQALLPQDPHRATHHH